MTNTEELEKDIAASGLKLSYLADQLHLTTAGLRKKIKGQNEFKGSEIVKLAELLKQDKARRDFIFLTIR